MNNNRQRPQWTLTDDHPQVRHALAEAVRAATWLRDEEAPMPSLSGPKRAQRTSQRRTPPGGRGKERQPPSQVARTESHDNQCDSRRSDD